jgi:type IV pilus assembly protein PilF
MMKLWQWLMPAVLAVVLVGCVGGRGSADGKDPERAAGIYADLGLGYLQQEKFDLALDKLQRALELQSDHPAANHYIAEVYNRMGETEKADRYYKKAIELNAENPMVLNNYGAFLCNQRKFEAAESYFLRAAKTPRYRTPELVYENIGLCARRINNNTKAEEYFRKALQTRADLPKSLLYMAVLSYESKQNLAARAFLQRFQSVNSQTPYSVALGIKIEQALGDARAVAGYRDVLQKQYPYMTEEQAFLSSEEK